ncbi:hypothetical protein DOJK_01178 [Patescibacteria group bacterium]|nr:hypothetical protein DOJK_01178 [Patescibacteria group bacterium]
METGQEVNWEMCTGIASSVIAICALILSVWQGYLTRLHNRISVKPHLTTWSYDYIPGKGLCSIDLINNGIGPAVIKKFIIKVDGEVIKGEKSEPIKKALKILFPSYAYRSHQLYFNVGYVMAAN